jgi:DNA-binding response OmpR family regulator
MSGRLFVLVVTNDPRLERQALCAVRAAGSSPMLAHPDEACPESVRRIRPDIVLLDTAHPCATSRPFYREAAALGARVIALAPDGRDEHARAIARRQNACCITLPAQYDLFPSALRPAELT